MKSKLTKIWGVGLVIVLLAGLLMGTIPTSAATLAWSSVTTPNPIFGQFAPQSNVDLFKIAKDGNTMFTYSNDQADTIKLVVTTALTGGAAAINVTYRNQDRAAAAITLAPVAIPALSPVGTEVAVVLNAPDTGVRDVTLVTADPTNLATGGVIEVRGGAAAGANRLVFGSAAFTAAVLVVTYTDNAAADLLGHLWKSTNAGVTWSTLNVGTGIEGNAATAMALSPAYATDSQVVISTATEVFRSINGGQTFGQVGNLAATLALISLTTRITSLDVTQYYMGGDAILMGCADVAAGTWAGGVFLFTTTSLAWINLTVTDAAPATGVDVLAVAFSPNHQADAEMMAVCVENAGVVPVVTTYLRAKFGTDAWDVGILPAGVGAAGAVHEPASAVIAFCSDYDWSANNRTLVGTAGDVTAAPNQDDLYAVWGGLPGGGSIAFDKNASGQGSGTAYQVRSVTAKGTYVGGKVVVGNAGPGPSVGKISDISGSAWGPPASKAPIGTQPIVSYSPTSDDVFAATTGANSAFSKSVDGAGTFNALALIDVSAMRNMAIIDAAPVDKNTIFSVMRDDADSSGTITAGDYSMVFKTVDAGAAWQMMWSQLTPAAGTNAMSFLDLSPTYATDSTVYIGVINDTRLWKSATGGTSWIGLTAPANITAVYAVDGSTYYTGAAAGFYKSGRWTSPILTAGVNSIAMAPDGTLFVGTNNSDVLQSADDGKNFAPIGVKLGAAGNNIYVAVAPDFATSKLLYAGSDGFVAPAAETDCGIFRWKIGSDSVWYHLDNGPSLNNSATAWAAATSVRATSVLFSPDGTMYTTNNSAGQGIRRATSPFFPKTTINLAGLEIVNRDLEATATLTKGNISAGSAVVTAVAGGMAAGGYGYTTRIVVYEDILNVSPSLTAPKDQTIIMGSSVTLAGNQLTSSPSVTLSWTAISSPIAITYQYQISTDSMFANLVVSANTPGTTITLAPPGTNLIPGITYYWRVRVAAASPTLSKWSSAWTFTPELPGAVLKSPEYGSEAVGLRPTFSWLAVSGADSYELEVSTNPFFAMATKKAPLSHTTWTWDEDLTYGTSYYWRVRGVKGGTLFSPWAESVFTVKTQAAPEKPPIVVQQQAPTPAPIINLPAPIVNIPAQAPPAPSPVTPAVIWAIIIIGAILVIAVVVLIVRTRRVP